MAAYFPKKGDFVSIAFDPQSGHEQRGRRPALVVSNTDFNKQTGFAMVCPITNTDRGYPFHVPVGIGTRVTGVIMVEQLKSLDYRSRDAKRIGTASEDVLDQVLAFIEACIY